MLTANRWVALLFGLLLLIVIPFFSLEGIITHELNKALESEIDSNWLGILIVFLLASDLVLPIPSSIASTTAGAALGFGAGTLTCWVGMSLGCLLGYWLGTVAGTPVARRLVGQHELEKAQRLGRQYGVIALVLTRAVPVLAEVSVIAAGSTRLSPRLFFMVTGLANLGISVVYSGVGAFSYQINSFFLAFVGAIMVPAAALLLARQFYSGKYSAALVSGQPGADETTISSKPPLDLVKQGFSVAFTYDVHFTNRVFDPGNRLLVQTVSRQEASRQHCLTVFVDDGVSAAWPNLTQEVESYVQAHKDHLCLVTSPINVPGGEQCKNDPEILHMIYRRLFELGVDRHSFVLAIGGGAVLDAVGYAAATTHRGVRHVRLPTTVLAQSDSGVGVKTGINRFGAKNFIGAFAPPYAVINDFRFLASLSTRDRRAGVAEAVKVAQIMDRDFFEWLEAHSAALKDFDTKAVSYMIRHCGELHMRHIARRGDPFEMGNVRPLDYGHWAAHKLESLTNHELRHGEAVAIGLALDARYSVEIGLLDEKSLERIFCLLKQLGFRLWDPMFDFTDSTGKPQVLEGLAEFRQHIGGPLTLILLEKIGCPVEINEVDTGAMIRAINWLRSKESFT